MNFSCVQFLQTKIIYTDQVFLVSLFKLMPRDILRNPDASVKAGHAAFSSLEIKGEP